MKKNIAETVRSLIEKPLADAGFSLWNVTFGKEGPDYTLSIEVDRPEGVSMDECQTANDIVEPIIDNADPVEGGYFLEVSSAGLDRDLVKNEHFDAAMKKNVEVTVKTFTPVDGAKQFSGKLSEITDEYIILGQTTIIRKNIAKASATFE